jgi:hypothetical protein
MIVRLSRVMSRAQMQSSGHPPQAGYSFTGNTRRAVPRRPEPGRDGLEALLFRPARNLMFPQVNGLMSGRGNHCLVSSVQRCGGWADMG